MKPAKIYFHRLALALLLAIPACSKVDKDDATPAAKADAPDKPGVTLDAETQERIGLKTELPASAQWQPTIHTVGMVVDPLSFLSAVSDLASARAAADVSRRESERTQKLADQDNASARTLENAQAAATHDSLALASAGAAFTAAWGNNLATRINLAEFAQQLATNDLALVKLSLAPGAILQFIPPSATIHLLEDETNPVTASLVDDLGLDPATQTQMLLYQTDKKMPRGAAVTGFLNISGDALNGVVVPFSAVLRHEGLGWVYTQTGTNQFARTEIPLDRLMTNGWFVAEAQTMTNAIIVTGAQTILSTELGVTVGGGN